MMLKSKGISNTFRGFTLMELLVVMVITSIVISMSLAMYLNFEKLFNMFVKRGQSHVEVAMFKKTIDHDFFKAKIIQTHLTGIQLLSGRETITYYFNAEYLIRERDSYNDTFRIKVNNVAIQKIPGSEMLVQSVKLGILAGKDTLVVNCYKEYDAVTLFLDVQHKLGL